VCAAILDIQQVCSGANPGGQLSGNCGVAEADDAERHSARVTVGVRCPKPVPLMVICVPAVFSITLDTIGKELSAAITMVGAAKNSARIKRGSMDILLPGKPVVSNSGSGSGFGSWWWR
jgi:hypothetical protein